MSENIPTFADYLWGFPDCSVRCMSVQIIPVSIDSVRIFREKTFCCLSFRILSISFLSSIRIYRRKATLCLSRGRRKILFSVILSEFWLPHRPLLADLYLEKPLEVFLTKMLPKRITAEPALCYKIPIFYVSLTFQREIQRIDLTVKWLQWNPSNSKLYNLCHIDLMFLQNPTK